MGAVNASAMRRQGRWPGPLALVLLLAALASAFALDFPALSGRVVDEAGVLDAATRSALTQKLADFETKSKTQLVVVTLKSLQGTSIEDFGVQLGRHWQIGQKGTNNGVLLIVVPSERRVRIEVGYGLEGTLTDAVSRLIIENAMLPRFRANDFPGGVTRGVDDIIQALSGDAADFKERAAREAERAPSGQQVNTPPRKNDSAWPIIILILAGIGVLVFCITVSGALCQFIFQMLYILALFGGKGSGSSSGGGGFSGGGGSFGGGGASGSW
jgi:uncharacterized protein